MEQDQIIRFITGNLNEEEATEVRNWINADQDNKKEFIRLKNIYALASEKRNRLIIEDDFLKVNRQIKSNQITSRKSILLKYIQYAAILAVALFTGYSASEFHHHFSLGKTNEPYTEFYSPDGQISEFKLTDGTKIWVNSGTRIKVPVNFSSKHRIIMMEGEAFFQVTKDQHHPFYINANELSVKVMGTSFNVSAYPSEKYSEITLVEGKVGVKERNGDRLGVLLPGQQLVYDNIARTKLKREVDISPYEAWRDGKMIFKGQTLSEIALKLERWFNVEINFKDESIGQIKFTGTILKNKPLNQVLEIITLSAPIKFDIQVRAGEKNQVVLYTFKDERRIIQ
jgi:ferric-dicitrate binding protein FerR (iron transport regulator)